MAIVSAIGALSKLIAKIQPHKHCIQTAKQSKLTSPLRVPKSIVQVPQQPPTLPNTSAKLFKPFKSSFIPVQEQTKLQAHHIRIQNKEEGEEEEEKEEKKLNQTK